MTELVGRGDECDELDRLVSDVGAGTSRTLVLVGEPGVGKTALLTYLAGHVSGWRMLTTAGVESEMELPYSGLQQLCAPLLDQLDELPAPQRDALRTVFGVGAGRAPDRFMIGLGTLTLLAQAADQEPLLCLVDDAQWLDDASAQILAFVARRLLAERIALICAARPGPAANALDGLPVTLVQSLDESQARPLLMDHLHGPLDAGVVDQILAESQGNPLALLELPRTWRETDLAGGFGLPGDPQSLSGKIERSYVRRLDGLPDDTRLLTLVAAADPVGDLQLIHRALSALGLTMDAATPAVHTGILRIGGRVAFSHPLARSSVYAAATTAERRRAHRTLADVTDGRTDPDRRAWHRSRATGAPDEEVASELERSADRAAARAGLAAAAAFLTRATELTPGRPELTRRALAAASANVLAGAFDRARSMITVAEAGPLTEAQHAQIELIRAQLAFASSRGKEAMLLLLAAARRLQPLDLPAARQTYLDAFSAAQFAGRFDEGVGTGEVALAAQSATLPHDAEPTPGDLLLDAFTAITDDYATAVPLGTVALNALRGGGRPALRWLWQGSVLAFELWDDDSAFVLSERHLRTARQTGALTELPLALGSHTPVLVFSGQLTAAATLAEEARSVLSAAGIAEAPYGALILSAWRGQAREALELIDSARRGAAGRGEGIGVAICEYSRAVLCNSLGRYGEAFDAGRNACLDPKEFVAHNWAMAELIEAAVRTGHLDIAAETLARLTMKARACRTDWALGIAARSRALVTDDEGAFREAIERLGRSRVHAELARAHLLYGEWLRRARRRTDAREQLATADEMFATMGMAGFGQRSARELLGTGAAPRKRAVDTATELTAQEALVAGLARDGLSNPQIGAELFLSARTVEWHLGRVFDKLGISSRRQLHAALAGDRGTRPG
ncbi:AAA family ATPase [Kribbella sp. CA-247076]|uniref:helix-turn-helix transcriptional regulator n=1 Tax=Kribbella sp. CA-247076 TaxID=3239941 RepID=UPI003D8CA4C7